MKTTLSMMILVAAVAITNASYAQEFDEQRVKILPTNKPGFIKLHYAMEFHEPLELTFLNHERNVIGKDVISPTVAPNGISKRYDVRKIKAREYWIKIKSGKHGLIYHIIPEKDTDTFTAVLESTSNQLLVKANN